MSDAPENYAYLSFNAPLSDLRARAIVDRLAVQAPATILDIGCGWGELLLRLAAAVPLATAQGVDTDDSVLERGRQAAEERGLSERVSFEMLPGKEVTGATDLVVCIGSTHTFGDAAAALAALKKLVRPGGRLLFGDAFWEVRGPVDRTLTFNDMLALPSLAGLTDLALDAGFRPLWVEAANDDEWFAFESGYLADLEEWLMTHAGHADFKHFRVQADEHRTRWLHGYRNGLGFAYLTLGLPA